MKNNKAQFERENMSNTNHAIANFDFAKLDMVEWEDIHHDDYPDYCDAFIGYAEYDGKPLTEGQLDWVRDTYPTESYENLMDYLF